jgi:uncharacterized protein (TIGR01777 family)
MRVLVTGGTGFIGRALAGALADRGDEPVVVSRSPNGTGRPVVGWEATEDEVARADAVVHLAGEPIAGGRWTRERLARIRDSRVRSTDRIASAIACAPRRPRVFVSGSAVGYYGMREDDQQFDEAAPAGDDVLARIAVDWEAAAEPARSAGTRVVHPRTGIVLGAGGGALPRMVAPFRFFAGGPIGSGRQWISWIHLRDAVRALLFALDREAISGPVNVVAPNPVRMEELAKSIGSALGRPAAIRVPPLALKVALGGGLARTLLTGQRVLPRRLLDAGFAFDFRDVGPACEDLLRGTR